MERTLEQIIVEDRLSLTDKSTGHSYVPHVYDKFFEPVRNEEISLLEIGTREGDSLRLWDAFFTKAKIYGMDNDATNKFRNVEDKTEKVTIFFGDAYTDEMVAKVSDLDFIIDDGPHTLESQLQCIEMYFDKLKDGGVMLIEDIQKFEYIELLEAKYKEIGGTKEVEYYDLRGVKNRYDDIVVVLRK